MKAELVRIQRHCTIRALSSDQNEALLPSSQEVLCSQARRGLIAASACLPQILQVLLASMPNIGKYQDSLKEALCASCKQLCRLTRAFSRNPACTRIIQ